MLRHRARSIEQQGARTSPRAVPNLSGRHLWVHSVRGKCGQGSSRVVMQGSGGTAGASPLSWIPGPLRSPGATWIFSPDFESRKTGQRGIMRKNRLFCNECSVLTHSKGLLMFGRQGQEKDTNVIPHCKFGKLFWNSSSFTNNYSSRLSKFKKFGFKQHLCKILC